MADVASYVRLTLPPGLRLRMQLEHGRRGTVLLLTLSHDPLCQIQRLLVQRGDLPQLRTQLLL